MIKKDSIEAMIKNFHSEIPLREFFLFKSILNDKLKTLEKTIENADDEATLQKFLEKNPEFLANKLAGGQGCWVIPKKRLGSEFIPDFVIGERSSLGFEWYLVELESPKSILFTKYGNQSAKLTHAINQIQKWRKWLSNNRDYASKPFSKDGLGLIDILPSPPGIILIGRRELLDDSNNELRRQISDDLRISIHTYDFLMDNVFLPFSANAGYMTDEEYDERLSK